MTGSNCGASPRCPAVTTTDRGFWCCSATVSPFAAPLPERTTPELLFWEAKYAALTSYGETFPPDRQPQAASVRQHVEQTATRLEEEMGEFRTYIASAESAANQVISRRMVKKQQMRWSPKGAHLLLQVRTRVLNGDLAADFAPPEQDIDHVT
ncbi:hypothetical protein GCM10007079_20820 [Nocardiopsis terrae]|uniref:Transposase n=1 Tax=Nocardiopsis terrae TaxID=372655 RepID=A0ABR9HGZ8_9ACTN|nr:hypothetical protein [Nocardiopsis terrae]GHC81237.1 hypothetical protein GCM10007079_20820 [Nocardiopsis terrae]